MRAKPTGTNHQARLALYESLQNLRSSERALAELCRLPEYVDVYECQGCHHPILDNAHCFIWNDRHYHNTICATVAEELTNGE